MIRFYIAILILIFFVIGETANITNETTNNTTTNTSININDILAKFLFSPAYALWSGIQTISATATSISESISDFGSKIIRVFTYMFNLTKNAFDIIIGGLKTFIDGIVYLGKIISAVYATLASFILFIKDHGVKIVNFLATYMTTILSIMILSTLVASLKQSAKRRDYEPLAKWAAMWYNFFKQFVRFLIIIIDWIIKIAMIIKDYVMSAVKALGAAAAGG